MINVIGLDASKAKAQLEAQGFMVKCIEYVSRRGVEEADSTRVIRQQQIGDNSIELTVSFFKTRVG